MVFILQLINYMMKKTDHIIISHALDFFSIFFYQGSIFYTQAQYFQSEKEC